MGFFQKLIRAVAPKRWAAAIEAESRTWVMRCPHCGHETSVWEMGGVRYKASGRPLVRLGICAKCDMSFLGELYRIESPRPAPDKAG